MEAIVSKYWAAVSTSDEVVAVGQTASGALSKARKAGAVGTLALIAITDGALAAREADEALVVARRAGVVCTAREAVLLAVLPVAA